MTDELTDEESDYLAQLTTVETRVAHIVESVRQMPAKLLRAFCLYYEGRNVEPFLAALESEQCDRATATIIYWSSDPLRFAGKQTTAHDEASDFELYKLAEARLLTGNFPRSRFKFDPVSEMGYDTAYWQAVRESEHIPAKLKPKIEVVDLLPQWRLFQTFETIPGVKCRDAVCAEDRIKNTVYCRTHHFEMIFKQKPPTLPE